MIGKLRPQKRLRRFIQKLWVLRLKMSSRTEEIRLRKEHLLNIASLIAML